jgi:hypothetical protein
MYRVVVGKFEGRGPLGETQGIDGRMILKKYLKEI